MILWSRRRRPSDLSGAVPEWARLTPAARAALLAVAMGPGFRRTCAGLAALLMLSWVMAVAVLLMALGPTLRGLSQGGATVVLAGILLGVGAVVSAFYRLLKRDLIVAEVRHLLAYAADGRGRLRTCLSCRYDLRGSRGATCPECGMPAQLFAEPGEAEDGDESDDPVASAVGEAAGGRR